MKWELEKLPTKRGWYLCKVNGEKTPLMWNLQNQFWTGIDGKTYKGVEWLNDETDYQANTSLVTNKFPIPLTSDTTKKYKI